MSDRGMKKWAPYKSLVEQDYTLKSQKEKRQKVEKPKISVDFAEEIDNILQNYNGEELMIKYYRNGIITTVIDTIKKIDQYEKKLVLSSRKTIMLSEIISLAHN